MGDPTTTVVRVDDKHIVLTDAQAQPVAVQPLKLGLAAVYFDHDGQVIDRDDQ